VVLVLVLVVVLVVILVVVMVVVLVVILGGSGGGSGGDSGWFWCWSWWCWWRSLSTFPGSPRSCQGRGGGKCYPLPFHRRREAIPSLYGGDGPFLPFTCYSPFCMKSIGGELAIHPL